MALILLIVTPLLAALATLIVRRNLFVIQALAVCAVPVEIAAVILTALGVCNQSRYTWGPFLAVDPLGLIVLLTVVAVGCGVALFSIGYFREEVRKQIVGFSRVKQFFI